MPRASTRRLPIPEDVRDLFTDLLGRPAAVDKQRSPLVFGHEPLVTGLYADHGGRVDGVCVADIALAAAAGAALALVPPIIAVEAVRTGRLPPGLAENFCEVANVMSVLLNEPGVPHLRLARVVEGVPAEALELATAPGAVRNFAVRVLDYPPGRLTLLAR